MRQAKKKIAIFIISDSTGTTAEMVIHAALVQFRDIKPVFRKFPFIKTREQVRTVLEEAHSAGGIVIYSLVSKDLRTWIRRQNRVSDIYAIDLLGPIIERIQKQWDQVPVLEPGLLRGIGEESLRVAEAIDFTMSHDDGQGVETLGRSDLIILGVSRTSKTPTSLYLSCNHGLKVANVPIISGMKPPEKIFSLKNRKIGLSIEPERLAFLRRRRWKHADEMDYVDISHIREELAYSHRIFKSIKGLVVIDVSYSSIEEVSGMIAELIREGKRPVSHGSN